MRALTQDEFKKVNHALQMNRVMAQDANGDYTREVTPKIMREALAILESLEVKEQSDEE